MHRHFFGISSALVAAAIVFAAPASADDAELREKVQQLEKKLDELASQNAGMLERQIDDYLAAHEAYRSAQGGMAGTLDGLAISADVTAVHQSAVGLDPEGDHAVNGEVDLNFDMEVTDNLNIFIYVTGNTFASGFDGTNTGFPPFPGGAMTAAAARDGIGVNGTKPIQPGLVRIEQAGFQHAWNMGDSTLNWELGALDPRRRFGQNAFADDEETQFIHNEFDDPSSVQYLTGFSTGLASTILGWHGWLQLGDEDRITVNWGIFNVAGEFFSKPQFMAQVAYRADLSGREANFRVFFWYNEFVVDDEEFGVGGSFDWWATETLGVWLRFAFSGADMVPVEWDVALGAHLQGLTDSRPNDTLGFAVGFLALNDDEGPLAGAPEDMEIDIELYYRFSFEDGKLQITPHAIVVLDPNGGVGWTDDTLFILGVRFHVPF